MLLDMCYALSQALLIADIADFAESPFLFSFLFRNARGVCFQTRAVCEPEHVYPHTPCGYAHAMHCPVSTHAMRLCMCYALSGTHTTRDAAMHELCAVPHAHRLC